MGDNDGAGASPWWRRGLAAVLLVVGVGVIVSSTLGQVWPWWWELPQVCADVVADAVNGGVAEACRPMSVTDPLVVAWLVVLAVLLLPDLAEVEGGGILTLRTTAAEVYALVYDSMVEPPESRR